MKGHVVALHIYDAARLRKLIRIMSPAIIGAKQVWITASKESVLVEANKFLGPLLGEASLVSLIVGNEWFDWSGFLEVLGRLAENERVILANDSVVHRRSISRLSMNRFLSACEGGGPVLAGELDCGPSSVTFGGQSFPCWISTYLFFVSGIKIDKTTFCQRVDDDLKEVLGATEHGFLAYLRKRRPELAGNDEFLHAKLAGMICERRLMRVAEMQGAEIRHAFAGSLVRKAERKVELAINLMSRAAALR